MIHRKYMLLSLLVVPLMMNAQNDAGINEWLSSNACWHYTKQFAYGALEGGFMATTYQVAKESQIVRNVPVSAQALVGLVASGAASGYIRTHSEKNTDGAHDASPILAWAANLAGYVVSGPFLSYILETQLKKSA